MPTVNQYEDPAAGWYVRSGYPIRDGDDEDMVNITITVHPKGQDYFRMAEYRHGESIEREVYYALLLDESLHYPALECIPVTINLVPRGLRNRLNNEHQQNEQALRTHRFRGCRSLRDFYEVHLAANKADRRHRAATLCLAMHLRWARHHRPRNR